MYKIVDAPSPRGSNKQRLYVKASLLGAAYDEVPKKPTGNLVAFLKTLKGMSPEGRNTLFEALFGGEVGDEEDSPDFEAR